MIFTFYESIGITDFGGSIFCHLLCPDMINSSFIFSYSYLWLLLFIHYSFRTFICTNLCGFADFFEKSLLQNCSIFAPKILLNNLWLYKSNLYIFILLVYITTFFSFCVDFFYYFFTCPIFFLYLINLYKWFYMFNFYIVPFILFKHSYSFKDFTIKININQ